MRSIIHNLRLGAFTAIVALASTCLTPTIAEAAAGPKPANQVNVVPTITSIDLVNGELIASGVATAVVHGRTVTAPFTTPVQVTQIPGGTCPILNLELGPIELDLVGLVVETSPICLVVTATPGGGLLGDLLCGLANALNLNTLEELLAGLGGTDAQAAAHALLGQITNIANQLLAQALDRPVTVQQTVTALNHNPGHGGGQGGGRVCEILTLTLGPIDLSLLGLNVELDDCNGGPVVVEIRAERGRGNLLGNLLCGLLQGPDFTGTLSDLINRLLARLSQQGV